MAINLFPWNGTARINLREFLCLCLLQMTLRAFILCFILCAGLCSFAQENAAKTQGSEKTKKKKVKQEKPVPENIEVFPKNFLIRPRFVYPRVLVNVNSRLLGKGDKFKYRPAMPGVVGLSLKIKKVYISAAIQLPASSHLKEKYGTTKFRNINININGRVAQWALFYRDYKGFYLDNYKDFYPNWNADSLGYPKKQGLRIMEVGLNFGINFNKNFSMNAAFAQGERQKKSAGSFLMGLSERYQSIETDTSFVPPTQDVYYPNLNKFQHGKFTTSILSLGFGYQFVYRKFHLTPVCMIGTGAQIQSYYQNNKKRLWINVPTYASFKAQIGYNGDHFFANVIYAAEYNTIPIKESRIRLLHNWLEAGIGLRF